LKQFTAAKKLDALDTRLERLEAERRALEREAFGAEIAEAERRARYLDLRDPAIRRRLIALERRLHGLRREQQAAAVNYWTSVAADTRTKLADLESDSPTSVWWRSIWWDVLTLFWIFAGAGWIGFGLAGAVVGTAITAACAVYVVRSRTRKRLDIIHHGREVLRSNERELQLAQVAASDMPLQPAFSAAEEAAGGTESPREIAAAR
jgi:hypothetical protein